jgi:hypothetical protein
VLLLRLPVRRIRIADHDAIAVALSVPPMPMRHVSQSTLNFMSFLLKMNGFIIIGKPFWVQLRWQPWKGNA